MEGVRSRELRTDLTSRLARLIAPLERSTFLGEHWERRALYVPGPSEKHAPFHLGLEEFFAMMRSVPKGGPPEIKASYLDSRCDHQEMTIRPDEARELYEAGLTICASRLHRFLPSLSRLAVLLIEELRREVAINCYVSPDAKGFGLHFDDHGVLVLQLSGRKRWWHGAEPCARLPRLNFVPLKTQARLPADFDAVEESIPRVEDLECSLLSPGDVLYIPPATWHRAKSEGHSVALTIAFSGPDGRELVREVMDSLAPVDGLALYAPAVPQGWDEASRKDDVRAYLASWVDRYKAAAEALDVEQALAAWSETFRLPAFHIERVGKEGLFQELNLEIRRGAKIGVIGGHGSGKSALLRVLAGLDTEFSGKVHAEADVRVGYLPGREATSRAGASRHSTGFVEDDEEVARAERRDKVDEGLAPRPPDPRREELRRLLVEAPELLLLDDPTEGLDADEAAWLEEHLARYPGAVLAASRDRRFLDRFAGWILELSGGEGIPWEGNYSSWVEQKLETLPEGPGELRRALESELRKGVRRAGDSEALLSIEGVAVPGVGNETHEIHARLGRGSRLGLRASKETGTRLIRILASEEEPPSGRVRIGERVRVARLDAAKLSPPEGVHVILVDETALDLDLEAKRRLELALEEWAAAVVVVSADRWLLSRVADEVIAL